MAEPDTFRGKDLLIYRETAVAGTYAFVCGIQTKAFNRSKPVTDTNLLDCDDPTGPTIVRRTPGPRSATIAGGGVAALEARADLDADFASDDPHSYRIGVHEEGYYPGAWHLTTLNWVGEAIDDLTQIAIELQSDGALAPWVDDATFGV